MISLESPCFAHRLLEKCFLSYPSVKSRLVSSCFSLTSKVLRYRDARFLPANRVRNCKVIKLRWKRGLIAHAAAICVRKLWQCDCMLCFAVRRIFAQMIRPSILQCSAICVLVQLMLWGKYWRYFLSGTSLFLFRKFDVLYAENLGVVVVVFWRYFTSVFQLVVLFMQSEKLWRFFIELRRQNVFFNLILFFYFLLFHEHKYNTSHNIQGTENEKKGDSINKKEPMIQNHTCLTYKNEGKMLIENLLEDFTCFIKFLWLNVISEGHSFRNDRDEYILLEIVTLSEDLR